MALRVICVLAAATVVSSLKSPFGAKPASVQPAPPKGFTWAPGTWEGKVVPTKPIKDKVATIAEPATPPLPPPAPVAPVVPVASVVPAAVASAPVDPSPAAPAPAVAAPPPEQPMGFWGRLQRLFGKAPEEADAATTAPTNPASSPAPTISGSSWGIMGERRVPMHRMLGTLPKPAPREVFKPPAGWVKPGKPVLSWYDMGERLVPESNFVPGEPSGWGIVPNKATEAKPAASVSVDPAVTAYAMSVASSAVALMSPAEAEMYLSGAAARNALRDAGVSLDEINSALAVIQASAA